MHARLAQAERDRECLALAENVGSVATWSIHRRTRKVVWSDRVFEIHARDKTVGPPNLDEAIAYFHPDDRARVESIVLRALGTGSPFHIDARLIDEQGVEKSVMSRGICHTGYDGYVEELFGVFFETRPSRSYAVFGNEDLNTLALEEDYHADT